MFGSQTIDQHMELDRVVETVEEFEYLVNIVTRGNLCDEDKSNSESIRIQHSTEEYGISIET